jgi:hypothetical protein
MAQHFKSLRFDADFPAPAGVEEMAVQGGWHLVEATDSHAELEEEEDLPSNETTLETLDSNVSIFDVAPSAAEYSACALSSKEIEAGRKIDIDVCCVNDNVLSMAVETLDSDFPLPHVVTSTRDCRAQATGAPLSAMGGGACAEVDIIPRLDELRRRS